LFDGKKITRAGLEDHFCGKLMGVPMGVTSPYTKTMPRAVSATWTRC